MVLNRKLYFEEEGKLELALIDITKNEEYREATKFVSQALVFGTGKYEVYLYLHIDGQPQYAYLNRRFKTEEEGHDCFNYIENFLDNNELQDAYWVFNEHYCDYIWRHRQ